MLVVLCAMEAALDLCETPTLEGVTESLQQGVVPRGVINAGNYTYDRSADSVVKCVTSCCLSSTCEVHYIPGAQFTKYLRTHLLFYDNTKIANDLRRTSNLQNIL